MEIVRIRFDGPPFDGSSAALLCRLSCESDFSRSETVILFSFERASPILPNAAREIDG